MCLQNISNNIRRNCLLNSFQVWLRQIDICECWLDSKINFNNFIRAFFSFMNVIVSSSAAYELPIIIHATSTVRNLLFNARLITVAFNYDKTGIIYTTIFCLLSLASLCWLLIPGPGPCFGSMFDQFAFTITTVISTSWKFKVCTITIFHHVMHPFLSSSVHTHVNYFLLWLSQQINKTHL